MLEFENLRKFVRVLNNKKMAYAILGGRSKIRIDDQIKINKELDEIFKDHTSRKQNQIKKLWS
jgi:hypothetical protein